MPRLPFLKNPTQLNLTVDSDLKRDGHIFASSQRRSLSQLFADWLRPLIKADKQANPERYGDRLEAKPVPKKGDLKIDPVLHSKLKALAATKRRGLNDLAEDGLRPLVGGKPSTKEPA